MKVLAALLLTALFTGVLSATTTAVYEGTSKRVADSYTTKSAHETNSTTEAPYRTTSYRSDTSTTRPSLSPLPRTTSVPRTTSRSKLEDHDPLFEAHAKPLNPMDILMQEIHTLEKEASNDKIQDEVAQTFKAEAQRIRPNLRTTSTPRSTTAGTTEAARKTSQDVTYEDGAVKQLLDVDDAPYEDGPSDYDNEEDDIDDDEYDDEDNEDEDNEDEQLEDEEEVMTQCPDYCRCSGQYAAATTATCTKLVEEQSFGTGIAHLRIENAGEIRLGPHALRARGLQQLESITITDTRIIELNHTAFDGIAYLFSVNLTRNGLQEIHPNTFQNNTQLSLLAISGQPLKHMQDAKGGKHGLFDAPSVTEFDFSNNGLTKLKRTAFARMQSLAYVNLKGNRLREIDSATFNMLDSLIEVDLSNNLLNDIPADLLYDKEVQTLRVAGNNLTTLETINASKLTVLDASNNRIKLIAKDDLAGVPLLDQLTVSSNGLKRIHQHAFATLDQLTYLDISGNKLTSLTEHHLRTNSRLQVLLMNDNPGLETLPIFKTAGLEYETYSIYRLECANCGLFYLKEGTFNATPALTRLNLAKNRLSGLPNGLLSPLSSLRVLDLSDNIISTLDSNMFRGAMSMTKLSLAGNPLVTLQVTPFLMTPSLARLDVSRCALERIWSEARVPLNSLRFLSVRENLLRRITVEELKAMPKISGLVLSHNPLECDAEFSAAVQWLTSHGVTPTESLRYASNLNGDEYSEAEGISRWTDLAKVVCYGVEDGPPPRPVPRKEKKPKTIIAGLDTPEDSDTLLRNDLDEDEVSDQLFKLQIDHGVRTNEDVEKAWTTQDQEYEDFVSSEAVEYRHSGALWPVVTVITLMILLVAANIAVYLAKRRGRGPVIRPPLILRQGLIDNKNCGLVYKPLQEEIATPHMPKRGSFYSSSTFHYDKIVPESV